MSAEREITGNVVVCAEAEGEEAALSGLRAKIVRRSSQEEVPAAPTGAAAARAD